MYNFYNFHQLAGFLAGKKAATVRHFLKAIKKKIRNFSSCKSSLCRLGTTVSTMFSSYGAYNCIGFRIFFLNF